jgi:hypothetical protein
VASSEKRREWTHQDALDAKDSGSYASSLSRSLALVLEEFYGTLRCVGVSAATGAGLTQLLEVRLRVWGGPGSV